MAEWYYIGPDRTGLACSICCAGFSSKDGSCQPYSCPLPPSSFRPYICPNSTFPTPQHVYKFTNSSKSSVSISVNSLICPSSSTTCWSYTPSSGLNAGGRIGEVSCSVSQSHVTSSFNCTGLNNGCPECPNLQCCVTTGRDGYDESCVTTESGCRCQSGSYENTCGCLCTWNYRDPASPCYSSTSQPDCSTDPSSCETCYIYCDDGTVLTYYCGETVPVCPGGPSCGQPPTCENPCQTPVCINNVYYCVNKTCPPPCPAEGYSCSCGECLCTTESTCCGGFGFIYSSSSAQKCTPCYQGWEGTQPEDCCDAVWKRKSCQGENQVCCNDGRCYDSNILCDFNPPSPF